MVHRFLASGLLCLLTFAAAPRIAAVEPPKSDWSRVVAALHPGETVQVVDDTLRSWEGPLVSLSEDEIVLRIDKGFFRSGERRLTRESVLRISRVTRGRNTLIGLGAGLAAGAAVSAWQAQRIDKGYGGAITKGKAAALFLTTFGGAGAGIGYAIPHLETLYRRPAAEPAGQ